MNDHCTCGKSLGSCDDSCQSALPHKIKSMNLEVKFYTNDDESGWVACLDAIPGIVTQGTTKAEAWQEMIKSIQVLIAYDSGIDGKELSLLNGVVPKEKLKQKFYEHFIMKNSYGLITIWAWIESNLLNKKS